MGKADRFCRAGVDFSSPCSPGPQYPPTNEEIYKYKTTQKWKIGDSKRTPLHPGEKFAYYNYKYSIKDDLSRLPKKWGKTLGGSIGLEPKIKYDYREKSPGPGRYEPNIKLTKPKAFNYVIGEQLDSLTFKILTGTNEVVGPASYKVENSKHTSIHRDFPVWSIGKDPRKGLFNRTWTKNETYEIYSSIGDQIRAYKISEPKINIGKSTRDIEKLRGFFPATMARRPSKVYIPLPKF